MSAPVTYEIHLREKGGEWRNAYSVGAGPGARKAALAQARIERERGKEVRIVPKGSKADRDRVVGHTPGERKMQAKKASDRRRKRG